MTTASGGPPAEPATPRVAFIAGEISGDILGASIIRALRERLPGVHCYGVAGPRMVAAGCEAIESIDALSVMGLAEVLRELPRLLRLRKSLVERLLGERPDVVVGIDAPDFNLGLEQRLRAAGLRTVHVVSPTVWAWRAGRVKTIARAVERILCLFPFEPECYVGHGVVADYIGHPLADEIECDTDAAAARVALGVPADGPLLTVMPGSRGSEIGYLAPVFVQAAAALHRVLPDLRVVTPVAKPSLRPAIERAIATHAPSLPWTLLDGDSRAAMRAGDAVLLASGTATLECLLVGRPMVVAYRASPLTALIMLRLGMLKTRYVSLPNLLCAEPVVPELLQAAATPLALANELLALLREQPARARQLQAFDQVRSSLRCNAGARAAQILDELLQAA
jgi:lipid-A-disaccharide synthase